ncbi:MAG: RNA polymerase sigma factor [Myxococcaceae bacterium]
METLSLRALFEQQYDFVWRSARRLGVPEEAADDAAQQVFLVASKRLGEIRPGSERAFLFGTAMRVASDLRRASARRNELHSGGDDEAVERAADPGRGPEELADHKRARTLLDAVVASMPEDLRAVFVSFELEGMTMSEIATAVDVPAGTVASRLRRAREHFQSWVKRLQARGERP